MGWSLTNQMHWAFLANIHSYSKYIQHLIKSRFEQAKNTNQLLEALLLYPGMFTTKIFKLITYEAQTFQSE